MEENNPNALNSSILTSEIQNGDASQQNTYRQYDIINEVSLEPVIFTAKENARESLLRKDDSQQILTSNASEIQKTQNLKVSMYYGAPKDPSSSYLNPSEMQDVTPMALGSILVGGTNFHT
jgi:hypothetical protein